MGKKVKRHSTTFIIMIFIPIIMYLGCLFYYEYILNPSIDINESSNITPLLQQALNITIETSSSLANIAILIISGIAAGIIFVHSKQLKINKWDWRPLVGAAGVSLALSYLCYRHLLYLHRQILFDVKIVDLTSPIVGYWSFWQIIFFLIGFGILIVIAIIRLYAK